jgi:hypothetical protein
MSRFPLTGRHKAVACAKCHDTLTDDETEADRFPAPRARTYLRMKDIPSATCEACHDDPHDGKLGKGCASCHVTEGWKTIRASAEDSGFHDATDFPLRGSHTAVACRTCHGPFQGQRAIFRGLRHARCADCHTDAHVGQLADAGAPSPDCDRCHAVNAFVPVKFDAAAHEETRFALRGAHVAVACDACHRADPKLARRVPASVRRDMKRRGRDVLVSDARLALPDVMGRCDDCHTDVHRGQFAKRARREDPPAPIAARVEEESCAACHGAAAFKPSTFEHDGSLFPLTGKHRDVACAACHAPPRAKGDGAPKGAVTVYRPLPTACARCHADTHLGQLARDGVTDCARCHATKGFKPARFDHNDPAQASFKLEGKHQKVACEKCHPKVDAGDAGGEKVEVARYKPLPTACAGCHADEHEGRFDDYAP